jgi:hypothetical protein
MTDSLYPTVASPYPARLTGRLDSPSRGLWLVKWFLAIPHVVVLFFLNIAVFVTTVIGFFAILFTGRYPRSLFDFAVGVLRWGWRVSFYAFSPLGTDTYPPFTLKRTDYPADFDVDYPESLSRGLVLVKWWLLAIPHYLIVGAVAGTSMFLWRGDNGEHHEMVNGHLTTLSSGSSGGWSLLTILVVIAAIALLFRGTQIRSLFELIVGINRWGFRVSAYAYLLTDAYPPFRLDQGENEPVIEGSPTTKK